MAATTTAISAGFDCYDRYNRSNLSSQFENSASGYLAASVYNPANLINAQAASSPSASNPTGTPQRESAPEAPDFASVFARRFADDFTWGATSYLSPYEPRSGVETYTYYAGMGASLVYGLTNGTTAGKVGSAARNVIASKRAIPSKVKNAGLKNLDMMSKSGKAYDRAGLTKGGRSLDKHGNRA